MSEHDKVDDVANIKPPPDDEMFATVLDLEAIGDGTVIAERYRLKRRIGKGTMGTVYLAEHIMVGRKVAVKVLTRHVSANPKNADRFRDEAQAATTIGHPNIVDVFDAGRLPDGRFYLVMEYLTGMSLFDELAEAGRLKLERAVHVIREITRAIVAAHAVGIIHRDLKPDNVMLEPRVDGEQLKVLDFGISASITKRLGEDETNRMFGTPRYMAPEQALGESPTPSFDIYAIGVIFYELLVGHPPISSDSLGELLRRKTTEESPLIELARPDIPPELGALIRACLRRDPAERPKTARQVLDVLDAWQEQSRLIPATHSTTHSMAVRRRWRMGVGALMIGMVTLVAGVAFRARVFEPNEKLVAFSQRLRPQIEPPHHQVAPSPTLPAPTFRRLVSAPVPPKVQPKKVSDEVCREVLSHVENARNARQHTRVASLLNHNGDCWRGSADYLAILAAAYFQTQRYDDCIKLGKKRGGSAPKVRKEIARCMAKSGATGG